jgi:hypothetical protein
MGYIERIRIPPVPNLLKILPPAAVMYCEYPKACPRHHIFIASVF